MKNRIISSIINLMLAIGRRCAHKLSAYVNDLDRAFPGNHLHVNKPILLIAMGKSASSFLSYAIPKGLGMPKQLEIAGGAEHLFLLNQRLVEEASKK